MTNVATAPARPATADEAVARVRALRPALAELAPGVDADGADATASMALLADSGAQALNVPAEYGGLLRGGLFGDLAAFLTAGMEIAAADGSAGQMWLQGGFAQRTALLDDALPTSTRAQIAHEILDEGLRVGRATSERGAARPTTARRVPGGIVVDGTKAFGTNSGGGNALMQIPLVVSGADGGPAQPHIALVRTDAAGLTGAHDWDAMGQRGTDSQTLRLDEVFVPDGWYVAADVMTPAFAAGAVLLPATVAQGIGEGALAAAVAFVRGMDRPMLPMFGSPTTDPFLHGRLGDMGARLAASRAHILTVARTLQAWRDPAELPALLVDALAADAVASRTAEAVSCGIFVVTGARSTARRHHQDRFWRDARTISSHHSHDATRAVIGYYLVNGSLPPITDYIKL